ncbi:glutamine synthetase/guanido kinase [Rhizodiscina lignyota]|uniref:Glutamine synthetase n=1 Tax=Rhizodiscina lignyota TaxID=1504668 RepID=A0A9P4IIP8_9PEZI|nr:glutamine synthetase/guanido kinase [Rhizodiscina lignyota]
MEEDFEELRTVIRTFPVIDNHAHNLLVPAELESEPFESITTEARGWALEDTHTSLSHIRAAKQLRELYGCDRDADWASVLKKRAEWLQQRPEELIRKCLEGTYSILMDDGLGGIATKCHPYEWHDKFTTNHCKRIVRIETLAEDIMESALKEATEEMISEKFLAGIWVIFTKAFEEAIQDAIHDPTVAGFKSVVCYRTGLDVQHDYEECLMRVGKSFERYASKCIMKGEYRIKSKSVNDFVVVKTLELLSTTAHPGETSKPLQFHTGLGDNDIDLDRANPAYLQPLIEVYTNVPFVILHSAYPYTREAGYLATVFKHVYLDVGEVFPMVSRDGQTSIVRQSLELAPYSKLLWSTDGHFFPETYWLANKQFREILESVLLEYIHNDDLSITQAIELTKAILFENSNRLYRLNFFPPGRRSSAVSLPSRPLMSALSAQAPPFPAPGTSKSLYDPTVLSAFVRGRGTKFVYVQWYDYMGTMRTRIFPIAEFSRIIRNGSRIGMSRGNAGTLQNDHTTPAVSTTGAINVEPDLRSLRPTIANDPLAPSATVMAYWRDEEGRPAVEDPRNGLELLLERLKDEYKTRLLIGFEVEVTFLRRNPENLQSPYLPLTTNHAWGTLTPDQYTNALPLLAEITEALSSVGITIQQFHSESGLGQYEFALPPLDPLVAIDTLMQTRQIIARVAESKGLRATLHPSPFSGIGTAAHAHISLNPIGPLPAIPEKIETGFWAGVLNHLEAICGFTLPELESYKRVVDDGWTGGTWICWGTQNRETPLRKITNGRWEVRCIDGCANMYLAISAIIGAGLIGLKKGFGHAFLGRDCEYNPARMTEDQRREYGIERRMPASLEAALFALENDQELSNVLAQNVAENYVSMKREEQRMLSGMSEAGRRIWLIERY